MRNSWHGRVLIQAAEAAYPPNRTQGAALDRISRCSTYRRSVADLIKVIVPPLVHRDPLLPIRAAIVGASYQISVSMGYIPEPNRRTCLRPCKLPAVPALALGAGINAFVQFAFDVVTLSAGLRQANIRIATGAIRLSFPKKRYLKRHSFVPFGLTSRYSPRLSVTLYGRSAALRARILASVRDICRIPIMNRPEAQLPLSFQYLR